MLYTTATIQAYEKKKNVKYQAVCQGAKDALTMLESNLLLEATARLKADHDFYYGTSLAPEILGDGKAFNSRIAVRRRGDYKVMVNPYMLQGVGQKKK
jgi:hypothetical protein